MKLATLPPPPPGRTGWPWTEASAPLSDAMPAGKPWPRVSIVTPSYNQGQFLEETIRSVLLQGYPNLEYMVLDGGSTDSSLEVIRKYAPWLAYWVSGKDKGQSDAINKGWQRSTGEIIAYLNSDDTLQPEAVARVARTFDRRPEADFACGSCRYVDEASQLIRVEHPQRYSLENLAFGDLFPQPSVFFRRRVLRQIGYLDERLHYVMDYEYWLRAALAGMHFIRVAPPPLANFRMWADAKSQSQYELFRADRLAMIQKLFGDPPGASSISRTAWAGAYRDASAYERWLGHPRQVASYFWSSLRVLPKSQLPRRATSYLRLLAVIVRGTRRRKARRGQRAAK